MSANRPKVTLTPSTKTASKNGGSTLTQQPQAKRVKTDPSPTVLKIKEEHVAVAASSKQPLVPIDQDDVAENVGEDHQDPSAGYGEEDEMYYDEEQVTDWLRLLSKRVLLNVNFLFLF